MKRSGTAKLLAVLCAAVMLLSTASCERLGQLWSGIKDEIDDLSQQIQDESGDGTSAARGKCAAHRRAGVRADRDR